jgi:hypothetical protein
VRDDRLELPATVDERTLLTCFLDWHREALVRTCAGLSDEQLRRHAVPSSNLTLLGLVRHLAGVERWYFQAVIGGNFPGSLYTATDDEDEDFNDLAVGAHPHDRRVRPSQRSCRPDPRGHRRPNRGVTAFRRGPAVRHG